MHPFSCPSNGPGGFFFFQIWHSTGVSPDLEVGYSNRDDACPCSHTWGGDCGRPKVRAALTLTNTSIPRVEYLHGGKRLPSSPSLQYTTIALSGTSLTLNLFLFPPHRSTAWCRAAQRTLVSDAQMAKQTTALSKKLAFGTATVCSYSFAIHGNSA